MRLLALITLAIGIAACDASPEPDKHYCERVNAYHATKHLDNPVGHDDYLNYCDEVVRVQPDAWAVERQFQTYSER